MSGALGTGLQLLDGLLSTAAWRGVTFDMIDHSEPAGRRVIKFLFPGRDDFEFEDLGADQGAIQVTGIISGDDYVIRAERMRRACLAPGPGILEHPWLGAIMVRLTKPAEISFKAQELRCARVSFTFEREQVSLAPPTDTLGALLDAADGLLDSAQLMLAGVLAPIGVAVAVYGAVSSFLGQVAGIWNTLLAGGPSASAMQTIAQPSVAALQAGVAAPVAGAGVAFADTVTELLAATPAAIALASSVADSPAIGPGGSDATSTDTITATLFTSGVATGGTTVGATAVVATAAASPSSAVAVDQPQLDPATAATTLLAVGGQLAALGLPATVQAPLDELVLGIPWSMPLPAMAAQAVAAALPLGVLIAARLIVATQAAAAVVSIDFDSQQDALTWRGNLDGALATLMADLVGLAPTQPTQTAGAYQAVRALRNAVAIHINSLLGQLPSVQTLTSTGQMSAWLIALRVSGDTPTAMVGTLLDIVRRNGLRNPAVIPAGPVQVLA